MYTKIRYRAKLQEVAKIDQLTDELEDICQANQWTFHRWDEDWTQVNSISIQAVDDALQTDGHAPLKGITFNTGPEEETIWLTFTPDGILNSLFTLDKPDFTANDTQYPWQRVKVRFGDTQNFAAICHLFRFIADKYCSDFQVLEETGYWTHKDLNQLTAFMDRVAQAYRQLEEEMAAVNADTSIDPEERHKIVKKLLGQFGENHRPYSGDR